VVSIVFALLSAFSNACTAVLQRLASVSRPEKADSGWRIALYLIRDPKWLVGLGFMAGTFVFQAVALYFGQLAVVQPILVTELIFTLALRRWWLRDGITRRTWAAAGMICIGLAGFLVAAHPEEGHRSPTVSDWAWALVSRGVVVGLLVLLSRTGSPTRRAAVLGTAAAIVWAVDAAFVKATTDLLARDGWSAVFVHWPVYSMVVTGVLGTLLVEAAFTAGPLSASQPALLIVDPLASIALGIQLFGEKLNSSPLAISMSVLGLVVMATGVVLITLWAPPTMTPRRKALPQGTSVGEDVAGAGT
jgi:drug/metabolite transporter (DMT)-like permease